MKELNIMQAIIVTGGYGAPYLSVCIYNNLYIILQAVRLCVIII